MLGTIRCCICGIFIEPNDAAMCIECIRHECSTEATTVTERAINSGRKNKNSVSNNTDLLEIVQCQKCNRWLQGKSSKNIGSGPTHWVHLEPESSELLHHCLKQFVPRMSSKLDDFKIVDSLFIWTEPHSRRLKVCVSYQRSVLDRRVVLQEQCTVELVIKSKQCNDCIREASEHTWGCLIQIRIFQPPGVKSSSKKATGVLGQLEQLLLTGNTTSSSSNSNTKSTFPAPIQDVQTVRDGVDLFFKDRSQAEKAAEVVCSHLPVLSRRETRKTVSRDHHH